MYAFYLLIFIVLVVFCLGIAGRFGDIIHGKAEDIKNIYIKDEFDGEKEKEKNE